MRLAAPLGTPAEHLRSAPSQPLSRPATIHDTEIRKLTLMSDTYDVPSSALEGEAVSDYTPKSYDIAPDDAAIADSIVSADPLSLPSASKMSDTIKMPELPPLTTLDPRLRAAVEAEMRGVLPHMRESAERRAIQKVLADNARLIRSRAGYDASVGPYWQEVAAITSEYNSLLDEVARIDVAMAEVARWDNEFDAHGKPTPKAVPVLTGTALRHAQIRQRSLIYQASLLANEDGSPGPDASRRLQKALHEDVQLQKAKREEVAILREAEKRAEQIVRNERVEARAQALAKSKRPSA